VENWLRRAFIKVRIYIYLVTHIRQELLILKVEKDV
jgi:hypothetical protein